jgi:hypothetical protein
MGIGEGRVIHAADGIAATSSETPVVTPKR